MNLILCTLIDALQKKDSTVKADFKLTNHSPAALLHIRDHNVITDKGVLVDESGISIRYFCTSSFMLYIFLLF